VQSVLLVAEGYSVEAVAAITGMSRPSVYRWLKQYLADPTGCLFTDPPRAGRPKADLALSDAQMVDLLERSPREFGYLSTGWTVALLSEHLRTEHQSALSCQSVRRRLKQMGLRWKRPRYVFSEPDPHQAQKKGGSCVV
jgi:transposase